MHEDAIGASFGAEKKTGIRLWLKPRLKILRFAVQALLLAASALSLYTMNFTLVAIVMALSLLAGAWFCGWACPFGAAQDWLGALGTLVFKRRFALPPLARRVIFPLRYILLGLSLVGFGYLAFLSDSYRVFSGLLAGHIAYVGWAAWALMGAFLALSIFIDRPFCRYLCLEGAQYGLLSLARVFTLKRNAQACVDCGACDRACPMGVTVSAHAHVRDPACVNCLECLRACPKLGSLSYSFFWKRKPASGMPMPPSSGISIQELDLPKGVIR